MLACERPVTNIDEAIQRIQDKRARCMALGRGTRDLGNDFEHVWHPPCIDVGELEHMEAYFDLRLPEEYRRYVSEVANGGMGPTYYPLKGVLDAILDGDRRDRPFVLEGPRVVGSTATEIETNRRHLVLKGLLGEDAPVDVRPLPTGVYTSDGTILVGESGCGLDELLVMNSPCRGQLWHDSDSGSVLRPEGFLAFVEHWLDAELARTKVACQAIFEFNDTERVRRVHDLLSDLANRFDRLHQDRLSTGSAAEWLSERDRILASGVLDWNLRFALQYAGTLSDLEDPSAVYVALAAFYFELRQDEEALQAIRHAPGADALLHARILLALGRSEEARPHLQRLLGGVVTGSQSTLWYAGEVAEVQAAFVAKRPQVCPARRAAALRYLGEHVAAIELCEAHTGAKEWARFELAANLEMMGQRAEALEHLRHALAKSYADPAMLTRDAAWTSFCREPGVRGDGEGVPRVVRPASMACVSWLLACSGAAPAPTQQPVSVRSDVSAPRQPLCEFEGQWWGRLRFDGADVTVISMTADARLFESGLEAHVSGNGWHLYGHTVLSEDHVLRMREDTWLSEDVAVEGDSHVAVNAATTGRVLVSPEPSVMEHIRFAEDPGGWLECGALTLEEDPEGIEPLELPESSEWSYISAPFSLSHTPSGLPFADVLRDEFEQARSSLTVGVGILEAAGV